MPTIPPLPSTGVTPVDDLLTLTQATVQCALEGLNVVMQPERFQECVYTYTHPAPEQP